MGLRCHDAIDLSDLDQKPRGLFALLNPELQRRDILELLPPVCGLPLGQAHPRLGHHAGQHEQGTHDASRQGPSRPFVSDHPPMREPDQRPGDRAAGMLEVTDLRDRHPDQGNEQQQANHLRTVIASHACSGPPADHRHQRDQAADHPGAARARLHGRGVHERQGGPADGGQDVPQGPDHDIRRQELPGTIPGLDHPAELVEHQQVEPEVEQA